MKGKKDVDKDNKKANTKNPGLKMYVGFNKAEDKPIKQMKLNPIKLNANKLMKDVTVVCKITGCNVLRVRLFVGVLLFRVAGFIIGCNLSINNQENKMSEMRAKMRVSGVAKLGDTQEELALSAVCASEYGDDGADENNTYARYTPCAEVTMTVQNPALLGKFKEGDEFYVDFTKVDVLVDADADTNAETGS